MTKNKLISVFFALILSLFPLFLSKSFALSAGDDYSSAIEELDNGDKATAFMYFKHLVENYPGSKYRERALFATGEYYFIISDFNDSFMAFKDYIKEFPNSKTKHIALLYLYTMAHNSKNDLVAEEMKQLIYGCKRLKLDAKKVRIYRYNSIMGLHYRLEHHPSENLEFYIDNKLVTRMEY